MNCERSLPSSSSLSSSSERALKIDFVIVMDFRNNISPLLMLCWNVDWTFTLWCYFIIKGHHLAYQRDIPMHDDEVSEIIIKKIFKFTIGVICACTRNCRDEIFHFGSHELMLLIIALRSRVCKVPFKNRFIWPTKIFMHTRERRNFTRFISLRLVVLLLQQPPVKKIYKINRTLYTAK